MPDKRADNRSVHRSESLYLAFVDTPGLFASIIRRVLKQRYVHVVLSLDPELDQAYSVGTVSYTHLESGICISGFQSFGYVFSEG